MIQFPASKRNYERMMARIRELRNGRPIYALIPLREGEYNCVAAAREVLKAGEIHFLNDVLTPIGVGGKILGLSNYKEKDAEATVYGLVPRISHRVVRAASQLNGRDWTLIAVASAAIVLAALISVKDNKTR